MAKLRVRKLAA